jgi:4-amino-4-deoxy-L-arabinose transferase-like glycosyltransferase
MLHSFSWVLGVFQFGGVSNGNMGGLGVACVLHALVTRQFSSFASIWASVICVFFFIHIFVHPFLVHNLPL